MYSRNYPHSQPMSPVTPKSVRISSKKDTFSRLERIQSEDSQDSRRAHFGAKMWNSTSTQERNSSFPHGPTSFSSNLRKAPSPPTCKDSSEMANSDHHNGMFGATSNLSMTSSKSDDGTFRNPISRLSSTIRSVNFVNFLTSRDSDKECIVIDGQEMDLEEVSFTLFTSPASPN